MKNLSLLLVLSSLSIFAQSSAVVRGVVSDESGAVVLGAKVTLNNQDGSSKSVTTAADGTYSFTGLTPGNYTIQAAAPDLALPAMPRLILKPGVLTLDLKLKVASTVQQVTVEENTGPIVTPDPASNASALVLRGEDLDALSDDPDDLANDLQALAGPSAGPNGGQIYIDGFSNGQLPSKDSIREIRVNQNPFSPEFDRIGFGRVEIFTKPGSDKLHGTAFYNFGDDFWNSRNPFSTTKAPFLLQEFGGNLGGPINKRSSYFIDLRRDLVDNGAIINGVTLDPSLNITPLSQVFKIPQHRLGINPRVDYQLSQNNTLVLRYGYFHTDIQDAGVGSFNLVNVGYHAPSTFMTVQATETAVLGSAINEVRFQFFRHANDLVPNNSNPFLNVSGSFNDGGSTVGHSSSGQNNYELQEYVSMARKQHSIKFGVRLRGATISSISRSNFNGTFTFAGGLLPQLGPDNQPLLDGTGQPLLAQMTSIAQYRQTLLLQTAGLSAAQIRALGYGPSQFSIGAGTPALSVGQFDSGLFFGDDWRVRPNLTLSLGIRYELQTNISDWRDIAPRIGIAWAPGAAASGKSRPKTVIRAGFGMFYDRFQVGNILTADRYNGEVQQQYVVTNPNFFPSVPAITSLGGIKSTPVIQELSSSLRAPYIMQSAVSFERQLPKNTTLAVTYANSHGLHVLRSEDINAPLPGTYNPANPAAAIYPRGTPGSVFLMESSGLYNQNQMIVNMNSRVNSNVSIFANYMLNKAMSNSDGLGTFAANPYSMAGEYGPASTDIRNRVAFGGSLNTKWNVRFSPFMTLESGAPFDITAGRDLYGTTLFTARPGIATNPNKPGVIQTPYGLLDPNPTPDEKILPRNYGRGPGAIRINMRLSKTFGFGPERGGSGSAGGPPPPGGMGGGPGGGGGHGGGGGGGNPFGGGMGGMFGGGSTSRRYNLTVSMSAQNLINHTNPGQIIGNITSPLFGQSNQISGGGGGGGFSENANNRRLELQLRLTF